MTHSGLRCIVSCLQLRDVDNMPAHAGRGDEAAVSKARKLVLLLFTPDLAGCARAVENPIDIRLHHFLVVRNLAIDHRALRPRNAGIGDENIEPIVEFLCLRSYGFFDSFGVLYIDLVGLACS
jgi:hypothetical protein